MELMSVASPNSVLEIDILEKLATEIPKMDRQTLIKWMWNVLDDLQAIEEGKIPIDPGDLPKCPDDWGFCLGDVADSLQLHNRYAVIYVIIHRLLFCNGELDKLSA